MPSRLSTAAHKLLHPWPRKMVIEELFVNDNSLHNHVHVASRQRRKLIRLAKVAIHLYGGKGLVREFPPFDQVDCVHTNGSWHYRDSHSPSTARDCAHRGDGLAFDLGSARRDAFAREVKRRYGAKQSDF